MSSDVTLSDRHHQSKTFENDSISLLPLSDRHHSHTSENDLISGDITQLIILSPAYHYFSANWNKVITLADHQTKDHPFLNGVEEMPTRQGPLSASEELFGSWLLIQYLSNSTNTHKY